MNALTETLKEITIQKLEIPPKTQIFDDQKYVLVFINHKANVAYYQKG